MPEDAGPERDTPQTPESGPEEYGTPAEQQVDYETRYNDLRPYADRQAQENAAYRDFVAQLTDPDTQAQALQALGLELSEEGELEDTYDDDDEDWGELDAEEQLAQRLQGVEDYLLGAAQAEQDQANAEEIVALEDEYINQQLDSLESELGDMPDDVANAIGNLAFAYQDEQGLPDVVGAFEAWYNASEAQQASYLESKQAAALGQGAAGTQSVNLDNAESRTQAVASIIEAQRQADELG